MCTIVDMNHLERRGAEVRKTLLLRNIADRYVVATPVPDLFRELREQLRRRRGLGSALGEAAFGAGHVPGRAV